MDRLPPPTPRKKKESKQKRKAVKKPHNLLLTDKILQGGVPSAPGMCLIVAEDEQQNTRVWRAQSGPLPSTEMHYQELHLNRPVSFPHLSNVFC